MVMRESFQGVVRGLPKGVEPTTTVSAPSECYPYIEQISYSYTQPDITELGYWSVTVDIVQDWEAESGSQWGPFTLTITSPGCQGVSFVIDGSAESDIFLKKYRTVSQLSDGTNIYWVKDIDAREMLETKANSSDIPTAISDLTDDTSTNPIDKAESVKDQRDSSSLKYWTGTKAQYDAIVTKDSDTVYNITDDTEQYIDNKANTSLNNITTGAKSNIVGYSMPSSTYIDITVDSSGFSYTAPANGYIYVTGQSTATNGRIEVITSMLGTKCVTPVANNSVRGFVPIVEGDIAHFYYASVSFDTCRFVYAQGEV